MLRLSLLLLCVPLLQACNLTTFAEWRTETYDGVLIEDKGFWRYSATEVQLSKALALDLAYSKCAAQFNNLIVFQAGLHGPITIQTAYDVMCRCVVTHATLVCDTCMQHTTINYEMRLTHSMTRAAPCASRWTRSCRRRCS